MRKLKFALLMLIIALLISPPIAFANGDGEVEIGFTGSPYIDPPLEPQPPTPGNPDPEPTPATPGQPGQPGGPSIPPPGGGNSNSQQPGVLPRTGDGGNAALVVRGVLILTSALWIGYNKLGSCKIAHIRG